MSAPMTPADGSPARATPSRLVYALGGGCAVLAAVLGLVLWQNGRTLADAAAREEAERRRAEELVHDLTAREKDARQKAAAAAEARERAEGKAREQERTREDADARRDEARQQAQHADRLRKEAELERQKAQTARDDAQTQTLVTERLRQQALDERKQALQQMVRLHAANGTRAQDASDLPQALLWFAEALRLAEKEKLPQEAHRLRLGAALAKHPKLLHAWFPEKRPTAIRFSPDGKSLALAGPDGAVRFHDLATGAEVGKPLEHGAPVTETAFSPDGKRLLAAAADGHVHLWDLATQKTTFAPLAHEGPVARTLFSPDGKRLLTAAAHRLGAGLEVQLWDAVKGEKIGKPFAHAAGLLAAAFLPDGRTLLLVGDDRVARTWDPESGKESGQALALEGVLTGAAASPDRRLLATAGDKTARVWQTETGQPVTPPLKHPAGVARVAFDPDGKRLLTVGLDGAARVWDAATGELTAGPLRPAEGAAPASFSPDGRLVVTAGADGRTHLWDATTGAEAAPVLRHFGAVQEILFAPDGAALLTAEADALRLWDLTSSEPPALAVRETGSGVSWFSPDGGRVLRVTGAAAQLSAADTDKPIGAPLKHKYPVALAAFSADGRRLLTVSSEPKPDGEGVVQVWDATTGAALGAPLEHIRPVREASFSRDGERVLTACDDYKARVWEAGTGKQVGPNLEHQHRVTRAVFSPDGRHLATVAADDILRLWDAANGERVGRGVRYDAPITLVLFAPDGKHFVTGGANGVAYVWECPSGDQASDLLDHAKSPVTGAAFSADGRRLVTLCGNDAARVWDLTNKGQPLTPPLAHKGVPSLAALSPDGRWLATAASDAVRSWDVTTGEPVGPSLVPAPGRAVTHLAYTPEGKLVTGVGSVDDPRGRQTWAVTSDARPATDLTLIARTLASARLDDGGGLLPWGGDEAKKAWGVLRFRYPDDFAANDARRLAWHRRGADECEKAKNGVGLVSHLDWLLARAPGDADLIVRRARARLANGDRAAAVADFRRAAEVAPDRADVWETLATVHVDLRRWDAALGYLTKAIEKDGNRADLWASRGRVAAELGAWDKAATDFARAITLGREDAVAFQELALVRLAAGDLAGYRQTCARLVKRFGVGSTSGRVVAWTCALAPDALPDLKPALQQAGRALTANPKVAANEVAVAALLYRSGQFAAALEHLEKARALPGADEAPYVALLTALAQQRLGRAGEAKKSLDRALPALEVMAPRLTWQQRLELGLLRHEAEEAVKGGK